MNFYIKDGMAQVGPFALLDIIRKIGNGSLSADMFVLTDADDTLILAAEHPELQNFFSEAGARQASFQNNRDGRGISFKNSMRGGWQFLTTNHTTVIASGVALGGTLVAAFIANLLLIGFLGALTPVFVGVFGMLAISLLAAVFMRLNHGQTTDPHTLLDIFKRYALPLIFFSTLAGVFVSLGLFLLVVPMLLALAFYSFTPMLIIDKNMDFWDAMEASRHMVLRSGRPLFEVVFGCAVVNLLGGVLFVLPLLVTLPLTYGALVQLYDQLDFNAAREG